MDIMCSRCKKRVAVVFMTRLDGGKTVNEGLCLRCAKELGLKPVSDLMDKMGILRWLHQGVCNTCYKLPTAIGSARSAFSVFSSPIKR